MLAARSFWNVFVNSSTINSQFLHIYAVKLIYFCFEFFQYTYHETHASFFIVFALYFICYIILQSQADGG
ncbi:MAG: hypothetical protein BGP01_12980 [Paludibacter sp. 47-17]|nr:MAG: hypothetical protein BGP01_12980 [Paludibacter sp. 47-17]